MNIGCAYHFKLVLLFSSEEKKYIYTYIYIYIQELLDHMVALWASLVAQMVKNLSAIQEIQVWSLGLEDPLEKGMATYSSSCPENSKDRGAWWATIHGVTKSQIWLSD